MNPSTGAVQVLKGLRTGAAVSETVKPDQVLRSIIMFGLIYILLGAVWVFVLNHKIQIGPTPVAMTPSTPGGEGLLAMERRRVEHRDSMSEAKE